MHFHAILMLCARAHTHTHKHTYDTHKLYNNCVVYIYCSRDCPIFYMRKKVQKDLADQEDRIVRFSTDCW